jgi:hypothetical protein
MINPDRYGAAVHEAGHVVVAWTLGLKTRRVIIAIDGDDAAAAAEIEDSSHLPLVDQIAICSAGADAQRMLNAPIHDLGAFMDMNMIRELVEDLAETEGEALRYAGYRRSEKILERHRAKVEHLARELEAQTELDEDGIARILAAE